MQGRKEAGRFGSGEERGREIQVRGGKRPGDSGQGRKEAARFRAGDEKGWEIQSRDEMRVCQIFLIILITIGVVSSSSTHSRTKRYICKFIERYICIMYLL